MKRRQFINITVASSLAIILSSCFKPGPGKTVEKFHRSIETGELDQAIGLFSSSITDSFGTEKLRLAMSQAASQTKEKGGIKSFKVNSEEITGDIAKVNYTIIYNDDSTTTDTIELIKENDQWKISPTK
jgi:hypothetical protein